MRITSIDCYCEDMDLARPYSIAFRTITQVSNIIVVVRTDSGAVGLGAASPEPHVTGETLQACETAVEEHGPALIGGAATELVRNCRTLQKSLTGHPAARAALDMALHDLFAQYLGKPLVEVLGRAHDGLPTSITIGIKDAEATLEEAREYLAAGFRVLKVKLGHDLQEDLERLQLLRTHLGSEWVVRVDPNQGYNLDELRRLLEQRDALGLEFVEQPLPVAQSSALGGLPADLRAWLAADESLLDEADAVQLLEPPRPYGVWNIKLMKCGGIYAARRIADLAEIAGIDVMWGCMDESAISISAALHAALASPATRYLDLDGSLDLAHDVASGGFTLQNGIMNTTQQPGLGVRLASDD
ncbi:MAG: dipeptide epimerase [Gammaproteobacteria bacterium]|nr:dipeptide epimerase [Gammaproteobacteria bacterium]